MTSETLQSRHPHSREKKAKQLVYAETPTSLSDISDWYLSCTSSIERSVKMIAGQPSQTFRNFWEVTCAMRSRVMKTSKYLLMVGAIALPFMMGCGSSTEQTKETKTTTYIPTSPSVVVASPPVVTTIPPPPATTSSSTEENNSDSYSYNSGNSATDESERAKATYHSETTTISPPAASVHIYRPPSSTEESTTTTTNY